MPENVAPLDDAKQLRDGRLPHEASASFHGQIFGALGHGRARGPVHCVPAALPRAAMPRSRGGTVTMRRFAGPCLACAQERRAKFHGEARAIGGDDYVPKMNVTPNAVALKDD